MSGLLALPTPPTEKPKGKIHRLLDEPVQHRDEASEPHPPTQPFVVADGNGHLITTRENRMPKGQYDRSKSKPRGAAANDTPEPATPRKSAGKGKAAKKRGDVARDVVSGPALIVQGDTVLINGMDDAQLAKLISFYRTL